MYWSKGLLLCDKEKVILRNKLICEVYVDTVGTRKHNPKNVIWEKSSLSRPLLFNRVFIYPIGCISFPMLQRASVGYAQDFIIYYTLGET